MKNKTQKRKGSIRPPFLYAGGFFLLAALIIMLSGVRGVQAWFTDKSAASEGMTAGEVRVKLIEDGAFVNSKYDYDDPSDPDAIGAETDKKIFSGELTEGGPAYVRAYVRLSVEIFFEDVQEWRTLAVPLDDAEFIIKERGGSSVQDGQWVITDEDSKNGAMIPLGGQDFDPSSYLYFNKIMNEDDVTNQLELELKTLKIPEEYRNLNARYAILVTVEAAQVANGLWKDIFQIDGLPFQE